MVTMEGDSVPAIVYSGSTGAGPSSRRPGRVLAFERADQLSLGRPFGLTGSSPQAPTPARPFGLTRAVRPAVVTALDRSAIAYDPGQQVAMVVEGARLVPWCRHTDGQTETQTNADGQAGPDSDTDHRED